jgi:acetylornithine deacetylase/succinyl-diaminopimelate desuccinylase-like protein
VLALGHDEEVGGTFGAAEMAKRLKAENGGKGELAFVLDEGGVVMVEGIAPFTRKPVAVIGTAEKVAPQPPSIPFGMEAVAVLYIYIYIYIFITTVILF